MTIEIRTTTTVMLGGGEESDARPAGTPTAPPEPGGHQANVESRSAAVSVALLPSTPACKGSDMAARKSAPPTRARSPVRHGFFRTRDCRRTAATIGLYTLQVVDCCCS